MFTASQVGDWLVFGRNGAVSDTAYISVKPFGDVNLAVFKPAKVSSMQDDNPGLGGAYAVDRDLTSRWSSKASDAQWLSVDSQATYKLNKVIINWENAYGTAYDMEVSNDASNPTGWTVVQSVVGSDGQQDIITFPETVGRFVRLTGKLRNTVNYGYSLYELEVYGAAISARGTVAAKPPSWPSSPTRPRRASP